MVRCIVKCVTAFASEHQEMVQQLLILGAQVDQAQECVVAVEDYQEIQRHTQEKRLACQATKEFVVV